MTPGQTVGPGLAPGTLGALACRAIAVRALGLPTRLTIAGGLLPSLTLGLATGLTIPGGLLPGLSIGLTAGIAIPGSLFPGGPLGLLPGFSVGPISLPPLGVLARLVLSPLPGGAIPLFLGGALARLVLGLLLGGTIALFLGGALARLVLGPLPGSAIPLFLRGALARLFCHAISGGPLPLRLLSALLLRASGTMTRLTLGRLASQTIAPSPLGASLGVAIPLLARSLLSLGPHGLIPARLLSLGSHSLIPTRPLGPLLLLPLGLRSGLLLGRRPGGAVVVLPLPGECRPRPSRATASAGLDPRGGGDCEDESGEKGDFEGAAHGNSVVGQF